MTRSAFLLAAILLATPSLPLSAQSGWDRYAPGSLDAIIQRHIASIDTSRGDVPSFVVSHQTLPTRATLIFEGGRRPIPPDDLRVLVMWARGFGIDTARIYRDYLEEWLFREGAIQHWLPVQAVTAESMTPVLMKGDSVTLWVQWFGAITRAKRTTWVFPVMRAQSFR